MANSVKPAIEEIKQDLVRLNELLIALKKTAKETSTEIVGVLGKDSSKHSEFVKNMTATNKQLAKYKELLKSITTIESAKSDETKKLARAEKAYERELREEIRTMDKLHKAKEKARKNTLKQADATERNKRALQNQKTKTLELNRAYVQLINKQKQAKKTLEDLIVTQGKGATQTKRAQKEYDRLSKKVNQANRATSNFSKGGLKSSVRGFRNLLGAFGIVGGIQMFANMTQEVFKMVKKLESLNFALKAVTSGSGELIRTQTFLSDISNKYGASIVGTTERYIKFLAAAKQSNVSLQNTEKIFSVVTKAAGVLGLKTDELSGIYLALEQMLSKGKVTTEELRRQLGERLPGAFGIMADALGVTTGELDKMLRKGEILSAEALPKFAEQLENIPYLKNAKDIDTVVASQNRLNNSWIELIQNIEEGEGGLSSFFKTFLDGTTKIVKMISSSEEASDGIFTFFANLQRYAQGYGMVVETEALIKKAQKDRIKLTKELSDLMRRDLKGKVIEVEIERRIHNLRNLNLKQLSDEIARLNEKEKLINDIALKDKTLKLVDLEKMSVEELKVIWNKLFGVKREDRKATESYIKGSIAYYEAQISLAKKNIKDQTTTREEYEKQIKVIDDLNEKLKDLKKSLGIKEEVSALTLPEISNGELTKYQKAIIDVLEKAKTEEEIPILQPLSQETQDRLEKYNKTLQETKDKGEKLEALKGIFKEVTDTFSEMFDIDISKFDFLFDGAKNTVEDWAKLSKELIGSVLDASLQRYDIELQEAQRVRDVTLNNDLATEEAKRNARLKFEREERRIKTERAKKERENALIKIAVDTAVGVVEALPNIPLSIAVAGLGALQAAIVASQPLPQFEKGGVMQKDGLAITQEKRPEPIVSKDGRLKTMGTKGGDALTYLEKGDRVFKSQDAFFDEFDMQRSVLSMNAYSNGDALSDKIVDMSLLREIGGLRGDIDKMGRRLEKLASRPINVNNKVELKQDRAY